MATFRSILADLTKYHSPLLPPSKPISTFLTPKISSLMLHPTLETALHLLNLDLPSAHFLVRHMQSAPAYEGMYLHGILHRIEGDYDNARAWYSDVRTSEVYTRLWGEEGVGWKVWKEKGGEKDKGQVYLDQVQCFRQHKQHEDGEKLEDVSRKEIQHVIDYCLQKFGMGKWEDATDAWVRNNEEIRQMGEDQVSGNSGGRKF